MTTLVDLSAIVFAGERLRCPACRAFVPALYVIAGRGLRCARCRPRDT